MKSFIFKPWKAAWIASLEPGTRIMTRRPVQPQPMGSMGVRADDAVAEANDIMLDVNNNLVKLRTPGGRGKRDAGELNAYPYSLYSPGDIVYVRETWWTAMGYDNTKPRDLPDAAPIAFEKSTKAGKTRVSIHLPERFARSFLKVVEVGAQRVQEIIEGDCLLEGVPEYKKITPSITVKTMPIPFFENIWQSMYSGTDLDWDRNPWVWIYTLEKVKP